MTLAIMANGKTINLTEKGSLSFLVGRSSLELSFRATAKAITTTISMLMGLTISAASSPTESKARAN